MIDAAAAPIYNESEEITGAVLTIRNVSSRKKAEMELAEARNLLTNLLTPGEKKILKMMVNGSTGCWTRKDWRCAAMASSRSEYRGPVTT